MKGRGDLKGDSGEKDRKQDKEKENENKFYLLYVYCTRNKV